MMGDDGIFQNAGEVPCVLAPTLAPTPKPTPNPTPNPTPQPTPVAGPPGNYLGCYVDDADREFKVDKGEERASERAEMRELL